MRRWRPRRRLTVITVVVVVTALAPFVAMTIALRIAYLGDPDARARTHGRDAVWLGHAWVDGRRGEADVIALARRLSGTGVHDLYLHTGPLSIDGRLDPRLHPRAAGAVRSLHAAIPGIRVQAWLGQRTGGGGLDLDDAATRERVVDSARQALDLGFDGVHYNFEPVPDGDRGLLDLLDRTRVMAHRRGAVVSMASHHIAPLPGMSSIDDVIFGHTKWWSPGYVGKVAGRIDQIAIMSYDTALPTRSLYGGYVRRQTALALKAVPPQTDLLMGLPAFHTRDLGHHASAETVAAAIRGVRLGLGGGDRERFGVALYADFAATDSDWRAYRRGWL
ncbi:MAG TPA: hypothetical protein VF069_02045 [Streptosporangiaceae bacterium]